MARITIKDLQAELVAARKEILSLQTRITNSATRLYVKVPNTSVSPRRAAMDAAKARAKESGKWALAQF